MPAHSLKACPRCDSPLSGSEAACPNCKRPLGASTLASAPAAKKPCPVCKLPLYDAVFAGESLLHCAECKGSSFTRASLMKLQPYGPKVLSIGAEERDYKRPQYFEPRKKPPFLICPLCSKKMKELKMGQQSADLCEACDSLWIEAAKLEKLNELLGPYKRKMSDTGKKGGVLSRMKEQDD